jgi:hypothetical protein
VFRELVYRGDGEREILDAIECPDPLAPNRDAVVVEVL